mmetsp:Transcript_9543/g.29600  ORF Transcript_9543/g.29600 Transcript_9543/m.29600 type:complete len:139 (+) Transcript_9543:101-517(+)
MVKQRASSARGSASPSPAKKNDIKVKQPTQPDAKPKLEKKASKKARAHPVASSGEEEERRKQRKIELKKQKAEQAAVDKLVGELMEGPPGVASPKLLPLRLLMRHRSVAWQWMVKGKLQYPIPIGSQRPLSPFTSSED